nr:Rab family GTPase [Candidatus Njordarchaeum guaymaensis]
MPRTDYVFKVVFVGDPAVGKTSLVAKHITSSFKDDYIPTLGANITSKDYNIAGRRVTLMIWDVASQERYKKLREKYYMGANAVFIVYDVTRPTTFENVVAWLQDVRGFIHKKIQTVLIGNKIDLTANVDTRTGKRLANRIGAKFVETSAKTGENV